jgi:hypothetical protein
MFDDDDDLNFDWLDNGGAFDDEGSELETSRQLRNPIKTFRRARRKEFINGLKREALNQLIPELPPPDVDLWIVSNGSGAEVRHGINPLAFDFGSFIPHIVRMLGDKDCEAYVSSWTMNENHVKSMIAMLDDGRLSKLTVFADPYFARRTPPIYAQLVTGLQKHGARGRYLAFKNHVKCIAIRHDAPSSADITACTITGSANLSAQPRAEQYVLSTDPNVCLFFIRDFFEVMLNAERE